MEEGEVLAVGRVAPLSSSSDDGGDWVLCFCLVEPGVMSCDAATRDDRASSPR